MSTSPTPEQIRKLPKWARPYMLDLIRHREEAVKALTQFTDSSTPSKMNVEDLVCDGASKTRGPSTRRHYVQGRGITITHNGMRLDVLCRDEAIDLSWSRIGGAGDVPMIPRSHNQVWLVAPKDLYGPRD